MSIERSVHPVPETERLVDLCLKWGWDVIQPSPDISALSCGCERRHVVAVGHVVGKSGLQRAVLASKLRRAPCLEDAMASEDDEASELNDAPAPKTRFGVELRGSLPSEIDADLYTQYAKSVARELQARGFQDVVIGGAATDRCLEIALTVEAHGVDDAIVTARESVTAVLDALGCLVVGEIDWLYAQQLTGSELTPEHT